MARYFFDTSALVKHYHAETGTTEIRRILAEAGAEHLIARLATVEILSGFATKVRTGVFLIPGFQRLCDVATLESLSVINPEVP